MAEQEWWVWRLEMKAVQRVNSTALPGGQSRKNSHRYTNPLDFTPGMKSQAAKFSRNLSPLLVALSLIISQDTFKIEFFISQLSNPLGPPCPSPLLDSSLQAMILLLPPYHLPPLNTIRTRNPPSGPTISIGEMCTPLYLSCHPAVQAPTNSAWVMANRPAGLHAPLLLPNSPFSPQPYLKHKSDPAAPLLNILQWLLKYLQP